MEAFSRDGTNAPAIAENPYRSAGDDPFVRRSPGTLSGWAFFFVLIALPVVGTGTIVLLLTFREGGPVMDYLAGGALLLTLTGFLSLPVWRWSWQAGQLRYLRRWGGGGSWSGPLLALGIVPGLSFFVPFWFQSQAVRFYRARIGESFPHRLALRHRWLPVRLWWLASLLAPAALLVAILLSVTERSAPAVLAGLVGLFFLLMAVPLQAVTVWGVLQDQHLLGPAPEHGPLPAESSPPPKNAISPPENG